ncbi:hypothetical protein, partial [Pseudomonas syringae]|uniref:hypothetical protein n=1 Tax=Pseudomonas syringae TaxID=317 RepID=UPI001F39EA3C
FRRCIFIAYAALFANKFAPTPGGQKPERHVFPVLQNWCVALSAKLRFHWSPAHIGNTIVVPDDTTEALVGGGVPAM